MRGNEYLINDVMDWFGNDIRFSDETEDEATARRLAAEIGAGGSVGGKGSS